MLGVIRSTSQQKVVSEWFGWRGGRELVGTWGGSCGPLFHNFQAARQLQTSGAPVQLSLLALSACCRLEHHLFLCCCDEVNEKKKQCSGCEPTDGWMDQMENQHSPITWRTQTLSRKVSSPRPKIGANIWSFVSARNSRRFYNIGALIVAYRVSPHTNRQKIRSAFKLENARAGSNLPENFFSRGIDYFDSFFRECLFRWEIDKSILTPIWNHICGINSQKFTIKIEKPKFINISTFMWFCCRIKKYVSPPLFFRKNNKFGHIIIMDFFDCL